MFSIEISEKSEAAMGRAFPRPVAASDFSVAFIDGGYVL